MAKPVWISIKEFPRDTTSRFLRSFAEGQLHPTLLTRCKEWTGSRMTPPFDYGLLHCQGVAARAHRLSWMIHRGDIPTGMHVCHACDNPPCVNIDHLFLGSHQDNMRDKQLKGRAALVLTDADVLEIRAVVGERADDIGARYGISGVMVNMIRRGEKWDHIGGHRTFAGKKPPLPVFKDRLSPGDTLVAVLAMMPPEDRGGSRRQPDKPFKWQAVPHLAVRLNVTPSMVYQTLREGITTDLLSHWMDIIDAESLSALGAEPAPKEAKP